MQECSRTTLASEVVRLTRPELMLTLARLNQHFVRRLAGIRQTSLESLTDFTALKSAS